MKLLTASILVGSVHAIGVEIADPAEWNALAITTFTSELILGAIPHFCNK